MVIIKLLSRDYYGHVMREHVLVKLNFVGNQLIGIALMMQDLNILTNVP